MHPKIEQRIIKNALKSNNSKAALNHISRLALSPQEMIAMAVKIKEAKRNGLQP